MKKFKNIKPVIYNNGYINIPHTGQIPTPFETADINARCTATPAKGWGNYTHLLTVTGGADALDSHYLAVEA